ncbi:MAG: Rab family GTPase, partial [Conexivisphaerales archaeon]
LLLNYVFKIVVLGDVAVGKTSLISRFSKRKYTVEYDPTTESEVTFVKLQAINVGVTLKIYDTVGGIQDPGQFSAIAIGANGFILVYEIDRDSSYNNVNKYYEQIVPYINEKTVLVLVGNKVDIGARRITSDEVREKASSLKMEYFETSAKRGDNVDSVFGHVLRRLIKIKIDELNKELDRFKEKDMNGLFKKAMEEANDDPFEAAVNALKSLGLNIEYPATLTGRSGVRHEFSLALRNELQSTAVDILVQTKAISKNLLLEFIAKSDDVKPTRKILVCVPKLEDEAKKLAYANKIDVVESYSLQDAAVKLFYMLSQQVTAEPTAIKDEIRSLMELIGQTVNH